MAAAVIVDTTEGGSTFREEMGAAISMTRTLLVTGLTAGSGTPLAARIDEARTAVNAAGFEYFDTTTLDSNLRVVGQEYSMVNSSPDKLTCTITYASRNDVLGPVGTWTPSFNGSLSQVQTANDIGGFPISVAHTFSNSDENHPGQTIEQGGRVPQQRPTIEVTYRGLIQPASIVMEKIKYLGKLNSATWLYGNVGRWLCAGFTAEVHDASTTPTTYLAELTFQADGFDWNPKVAFIDPATGKEPPDLVNGVGIKRVFTFNYADFNDLIPTE